MKLDPSMLDPEKLLRWALPKPRKVTEEEKRHGTFNRRMIAASIDTLLITALIAPVVDYFFIRVHGAPEVGIDRIAALAAQQTDSARALQVFLDEMESTGYLARWAENLKWQVYAASVYLIVCWHFWSATPGKLLCKLKIVDAKSGGRMGDWQSILRLLGYFISAAPFGLGFFWIAFNKKRRGWHDYLAGTEVVLSLPRRGRVGVGAFLRRGSNVAQPDAPHDDGASQSPS